MGKVQMPPPIGKVQASSPMEKVQALPPMGMDKVQASPTDSGRVCTG
jgi:hypothetical protein